MKLIATSTEQILDEVTVLKSVIDRIVVTLRGRQMHSMLCDSGFIPS
jgi:hypothetical protein